MLFPAEERRAGWINVGDLASAVHFKIVKYERIKFLVIALRYLLYIIHRYTVHRKAVLRIRIWLFSS